MAMAVSTLTMCPGETKSGLCRGWVRTAAVRTALNLRRRARREVAHAAPFDLIDASHEPPGELAHRSDFDPLLALLRARHKPQLEAALRRALTALAARDRLLLQLYYGDGLTLARIAAIERIGTATVFRRLNAATRAVLAAVRRELGEALRLSVASVDSLIRHVPGDLDLGLSQALGGAAADPA